MRWQRQSVWRSLLEGDLAPACRRLMPSVAAGSFVLAGAIFMLAPSEPVVSRELVTGTVETVNGTPERGMPATDPRVRAMISSHPGQMVVVCVAGCGGRPHIVQTLPKPREVRTGEMRTTSGSDIYGNQASSNAVTCIAGCPGRPGQAVQRLSLPPPPQHRRPGAKPNKSEPWYDELVDELP